MRATWLQPDDGGRTEDSVARAMNAWWSHILADEVTVNVEEVARLGYSVRLDTSAIASRSLGQVGFGLSQLWPILVACLASRPGDLVLIETPEAHLHPGAQHRLTALFVALARLGRQVIVETHSEHIVAAACLALKRTELSPEDLALSFFTQSKGHTRIERIAVDASGRRLRAPEGFFDQATAELLELLR
jgi:predicted ATPase